MSDASSESFPFWSLATNPSLSVSTMNPRIDFGSSSSPIFAQMIATSATDPLVIHILVPVITHSSPSFVARVTSPPGFDP